MNRSDVRNGFRVDRMEPKRQGSDSGQPSVFRQTQCESVNQVGDGDVRQGGSEVPSPRVQSEQRVIGPQPDEKERPVEVGQQVRVVKAPDVGGKISGEITPGANGVVGDDERLIVKDKAQV